MRVPRKAKHPRDAVTSQQHSYQVLYGCAASRDCRQVTVEQHINRTGASVWRLSSGAAASLSRLVSCVHAHAGPMCIPEPDPI